MATPIGLAFTGWFRRAPDGFSMHRRTSYLAVVAVVVLLIFVESAAAHVLLSMVSVPAARVASVLSAYSLLWFVGNAHAARLRPLRVTADGLVVEKGAVWSVFIPKESIVSTTPIDDKVPGALDLSYLSPNVLITLRDPVLVRGPFGITRTVTRITLSLDDRDGFLGSLASA